MWTGRIGLEASAHAHPSWFVTLTYDEDHVPARGELSRSDWRAFSKGIGCRYFGVGEYGGMSGRPHYHAILFGLPPGTVAELVQERWRKGFVSVSPYSRERGAYVAGYVVKKWTRPIEQLEGRLPEFAVMSRRPGIGVPGLAPLAEWLVTSEGAKYIARQKDVPHQLKVDGQLQPLGDTCVSYLRQAAGMPESDPNRLANVELRNAVRASEFPDLEELRERRRVQRYDKLKRAGARRSSGSVL